MEQRQSCKFFSTRFVTGSTKEVCLTVFVDKEAARAMNSGDENLEDILVLHLEGGKDFFVSLFNPLYCVRPPWSH